MRDETASAEATRLAVLILRARKGWNRAQLAAALRVAPSGLAVYEREKQPRRVPRKLLTRIAEATGFPPALLPQLLDALRSFSTLSEGWAEARRLVEGHQVAEVIALAGEAAALILTPVFEGGAMSHETPHPKDREEAGALWVRLSRRSRSQRLALIQETDEFRSWALCELLAAKSVEAAPDNPSLALELAELAVQVAEVSPGVETWRIRLQGYALAHVANARRVLNDLPGADADFERARRLWDAGRDEAGLLNEVWMWWIEATLRKGQRRLSEALVSLDRALDLAHGSLRGKLLLTKAQIHTVEGDLAASTAALSEALSLIDSEAEPRAAMGILFQLVRNLCYEERANEAAAYLPAVRKAAQQLGQEMDSLRVKWLEGVVAGGQGRIEEAIPTLENVRQEFAARKLPYDYSLISLELAVILLQDGREREVSALAEDMFWIFCAEGVHREALAALDLFREAARQQRATIPLTLDVLGCLSQAVSTACGVSVRVEVSG